MGTGIVPLERTYLITDHHSEFDLAQEYEDHANLWIHNDSDFLALVADEGWEGTGTPNDPIIIEGYRFFDTEMQPVRFWDTTLHWIFRNNFITTDDNWCGLWALRTQNGIVANNIFDTCHSGIYLEHAQGLIIENNTFRDNSGSGVDGDNPVSDMIIRNNEMDGNAVDGILFKYPATNITIVNNYIHGNTYDSIDIRVGEDITIENNLMENQRNGIKIANQVTNCVVKGNTIRNIPNSGIYLSGDYNEITNNTLRNIGENGIILKEDGDEYPEHNIINVNTIINCTEFGVLVEAESEDNTIQDNSFFESGESCHICDDSTDTTIINNFYDTWATPDADGNGFVDTPYSLVGTAENADPTPRASPSTTLPDDYEYVPMTPTATDGGSLPLMEIAVVGGIGLVVCIIVVIFVKKR
jgi:parallel beta-helix repeat protein